MNQQLADFPGLERARTRRTSPLDAAVILAAFAATLLLFQTAYDDDNGAGSAWDGLGNALTYLAVASYVRLLPALWKRTLGRWTGALVLPALILLVIPYFYFTFLAYYLQPRATLLAFFTQLIVFTIMSCRF